MVRRHRHRRGSEVTGSVWILAPAAVLVLAILGAIAIDSASVYLGQRELANTAQSAALDAAGAVSRSAFYSSPGGSIVLNPQRAAALADRAVAAAANSSVVVTSVAVQVRGDQVCVSLRGEVPAIFGRALPGVPPNTSVQAVSVATAAVATDRVVPQAQICPQ